MAGRRILSTSSPQTPMTSNIAPRPFGCYRKVADSKGEEMAARLLQKNPEAVISGKPMLPQPPPMDPSKHEGKRNWFSFFGGGS